MPSMCRYYARHRDMVVTNQTWNSSNGVEERGKHKMTQSKCKIPGVGSAIKDTPWLSECGRGSFEAEKAALYGMARKG